MTSLWLDRSGARLAFEDTGGPRPTIIFQHGLLGDGRQVAEILPSEHAWRRLTLDCRGHGGSEPGDIADVSIAGFAEDVAVMAAERGVMRAIVGGVSMGAAIALTLAVRRPDLVAGLILLRPAWIAEPGPENLAANREVGRLLAMHESGQARALFEASPTHARLKTEAPDNLASLMGFFDRPDRAASAGLLTAIATDGPPITRASIAALRVPTLVIGQDADVIHPFALASELAGLIAGAELLRVTPKGADKPRHLAEVRAAIDAFLTRNPL